MFGGQNHKDYDRSLSDYAECLMENKTRTGADTAASSSFPIAVPRSFLNEGEGTAVEETEHCTKHEREMDNPEPAIECPKKDASMTQEQIDASSEKGVDRSSPI